MAWRSRILGGILTGLGGVLVVGCTSSGGGVAHLAPGESLVADITPRVDPRLARAQVGEGPPLTPRPATPAAGRPAIPPSGTQQTSLSTASSVRVKIRAWVNAKPIFDDEVMQMIGPSLKGLGALPEPQRSEKLAEAYNQTLEQIIDQEVMYQDAVKKLEKNNPRALDKLKEAVGQEFEKQLQKMREAGITEDQLKEVEPTARRLMERNLIATEYARNRVVPYLNSRVSLDEVREYYDSHMNEFQAVDKVVWQDVFIAVGPKRPTLNDARQFAEGLLAKCKSPDDFAKLLDFDDGDSKFRGGEGLGQRRGEIRPPELEPYLFKMEEGQVGPAVALSTGVHIFRVTKREHAGQIPLNDKTQKQIKRKLENQLAEREYKRIVRELRGRSVVRVEREEP